MNKTDKSKMNKQRERLKSHDYSSFDEQSPVEAFTSKDIITQKKVITVPKRRFNFLIDEELINNFMTFCKISNTDASKILVEFIEETVNDNRELIEQFEKLQSKLR